MTPNLLIFASGTPEGGGSGFENLINASRDSRLSAKIVAVVSNHEHGGVQERAKRLNIPFIYFPGPYTAEQYKQLVKETDAHFIALSGWLKLVKGLDPRVTFNIHPGPLPEFGGPGLYGHHVHEAVLKAFQEGRATHSAVSMHFVTEKIDDGPVFFSYPVAIQPNDTVETLAKRVNEAEHRYQPEITNLVVNGQISWNGSDPKTLRGASLEQ